MKYLHLLLISWALFVVPSAYASITATPTDSGITPSATVKMMLIANTFSLNRHTVAHASLSQNADGQPVVNVVLTDTGEQQLEALTQGQIGKQLMLTWNKTVISLTTIQSSLGDSFQLTGLNSAQAQAFVNSVQTTTPTQSKIKQ